MKTRIISGLVGTVLLVAVLFCPYTWVFALTTALLAALAVWELLHNTDAVPGKLLPWGCSVFATVQVLVSYRFLSVAWFNAALDEAGWAAHKHLGAVMLLLPLAFLLFVAVWWLCRRVNWKKVGYALLTTLYATIGFGSLALLRVYDSETVGLWAVLLAFVIPFMSDTGAYFTGTFFGKHKMAPVISPKKSWEGFFGGWVISIGCAALLAVIHNVVMSGQGVYAEPLHYAILAAVLAPISVGGDLLASMIKRHYGIKDYGNLMPGHGGVMDRFDSVVMIAPLLFILLYILRH